MHEAAEKNLKRAAIGWAMFDVGRFPVIMLVIIFVFVPYFATAVAPDPVTGQALTARFSVIAGLLAAPTAPLLGAVVDRLGPCKPWLVACIGVIATAVALLWFVQPDSGLPIPVAVALLATVSLFLTYGEVLGNAMLAALPGGKTRAKASGLALSAGNTLSLLLMLALLWGFLLPGTIEASWLPAQPLLGLQRASFENVRVVTLIAAGSLLLAAVPFMRLSADRTPTGLSISQAVRGGIADIAGVVKNIRRRRDPATYLLARTIFQDASTAVMQLIGVYAAGTMGWHAPEMTVFGIICVVMGIFGGFLAGRLDFVLGPKRALQIFVLVPALCLFLQLGTDRTTILYFWTFHDGQVPTLWNAGIFKTLPELTFLACAAISSAAQVAALSSSRMLLTSLLRNDEVAIWFGLAALAGASTAWIGPLLVGVCTTIFASQRSGFVPLIVMLIIGALILSLIRGGGPALEESSALDRTRCSSDAAGRSA